MERKFNGKKHINIYPLSSPPIIQSPLQPIPTSAVAATGFEILNGKRFNY
jgi:hypothetical protein